MNNSAPNKKMVLEMPYLRSVRGFKTSIAYASEKSKGKLDRMRTELRIKLLEPPVSSKSSYPQ